MSGGSPEPARTAPPRRILALVLPDFLVELAQRKRFSLEPSEVSKSSALGVVLVQQPEKQPLAQLSLSVRGQPLVASGPELPSAEPLAAVSQAAERFGVRAGQSIAEASALVSQLVVTPLAVAEVEQALGSIAELAFGFGATVALAAPDTVWVDITGAAHLFGGEEALARELSERVRELGHRTRVAISVGPELSRAFARWASPSRRQGSVWVIPPSETRRAAAELPIGALPISAENLGYLTRLGLLSLGDLARQPRSALGPRLGKEAARVLSLCAGEDAAPLVPYQPPRVLLEESSWDEPVSGAEPLGFVLRGLAARISARLAARGEAAEELLVTLLHDRIIARFRGAEPQTELHFKLAQPIYREAELRRIVASRLERLKLAAPTLGMKLTVPRLGPMVQRQLSLSELFAGDTSSGEEDLPIVLAELTADIGEERVGVLSLVDAHRPEAQSSLRAALPERERSGKRKGRRRAEAPASPPKTSLRKTEPPIWSKLPSPPTRLLSQPLELSSVLSVGSTLVLGHTLYTIERLRFEQRLDAVEWWSRSVARDYLRLWLAGESGGLEALVYVDRKSGRRFLQAVGD